jgi:ketosteroid isomerase-like protein
VVEFVTETETVQRFIDALNAGDIDLQIGLLDPDVQLETNRGPRRGIEAARESLMKHFDHLVRYIGVEDFRAQGRLVVALVRVELLWKESGEQAETYDGAAVATVRDGRIVEWELFQDRAAAMAAAGME